ncbi:MAG: TonB family protein [Hyphomonadaceae bacterium]|nr:TonB family protein [Hyphomonadaceae bacterium]
MLRFVRPQGLALGGIASVALHLGAVAAALAFVHAPPPQPGARPLVAVSVVQAMPLTQPLAAAPTRMGAPRVAASPSAQSVRAQDVRSDAASDRSEPDALGGEPASGAPALISAAQVLDAYSSSVWTRLAQSRPHSVRGAGTARVVFGLDASGHVRFVRLARSSGSAAFDQASVAAVRAAAPFPTPPATLNESELVFEAPIESQRRG